MEQPDKFAERPQSLYAEAEAQLAMLGDDQRVVFYITARHGAHSADFGGRAGIAVSTIRQAPSLRDFILGLLANYSFNGPRGDGDRIDEDEIDNIQIEEHFD